MAKVDEGRTIIMASQHLEEAESLANRVCILKHGKIIKDDTPAKILQKLGDKNLKFSFKGTEGDLMRILGNS